MEQIKTITRLNKFIAASPWCERQVFDEISESVKSIFKEYRDAIDIADHYRYLGNMRKYKSLLSFAEKLLDKLDHIANSGEWEVRAIIKNLNKSDKNSPYLLN